MEIDIEKLVDDFRNHRITILCTTIEERYQATVLLLEGGVNHGTSGASETIANRNMEYGAIWKVLFCSSDGIEYCTADAGQARNVVRFQDLPNLYPFSWTPFETDEKLFGEFFHVATKA